MLTNNYSDEVLINLENVSFYRAQRRILHDISMQLARGETLTIVGPNGAGKSTLLAIILGQLTATSGRIYRARDWRCSYVPQKCHFAAQIPLTLGRFLKDITAAKQSPWLRKLNLLDLWERPIQSLSGGETKKLLLARALMRNSNMIVLDEPAAGIDSASLELFYQTINEAQRVKNFAIIMVSHDLHIVFASSDKVLCLNEHICCQGTPSAVHNHPQFKMLLGDLNTNFHSIYAHQSVAH